MSNAKATLDEIEIVSLDSLSHKKDDVIANCANETLDEERQWVNKIQKNNYHAFEELFSAYQGRIFAFIKNSLNNTSDTEELTQEVFLKIWINRHKINPDLSLNSYIYKIAKNVVFDFLRKKLNEKKYIEAISKDVRFDDSGIENLYYNEALELINHLIEQLPPKCQKIFLLNRFDGESYRSIAKKLNISENTVDTQMRKALRFLRNNYPHITKMILFFI